jgi:5-methylcytosine-specific restriction protein A
MTASWRTDRRTTAERGYGGRWQRERAAFLKLHPLCVMCEEMGEVVEATVVDHKIPHRGDQELMWDQDNWQPLCKPHHDGDKQQLERSGTVRGCSAEGVPLDPNHHWSKPTR